MILDQLSSVSDDVAALEPWTLTGGEVKQVAIAVARARTSMDAALSRLAGCAEEMGLAKDDGATSTTVWLANATGISKGEAAKLVSLARVSGVEATQAAWAAGGLSTDQASVIMKAIDALPDWCGDEERGDAEAHLIRLAGEYGLDDLKRLANRVLEVIDPDGADEHLGEQLRKQEQKGWDATKLSIRRRGDGTTHGAFTIPDADADTLRAALEGIIAPRRTAANAEHHGMGADDWLALPRDRKLGHAFTELITHLPTGALPQSGGLAATVAVTVDVDDLRTGQGVAENTSGTTMSARKAQRLACNAHLVALYLENGTRVIDHGMTKRLYDRHQRLALAVRDKGCVFPDCDRPPAWCEAHHLSFWSEGGPTDLNNAALLCHFHHFLVHEGEWEARMGKDGVPEIIPPPRIDPEQRPRRHARFIQQEPRAA
ncbi:HNH endonuclease signature motif containing protein [Aeromicrobium wangtongii]|uniref:HNH endonuclease n=1 Tax=Aeromicrobium wangtongii TaxID=2969247 RepID=A0ABY5MD11_9ACTN|nr:HNH endonuclease signature motif containing protein [Aeromicrobium wangtongii]MCD9197883.1 HNH endonuclease [Aeromicrobium wangtongii]UUP15362.1 HNH endonuclease [Aeromicrobium wangtongii]